MSPEERRIIKQMHDEQNMTPNDIAKLLGRHRSAAGRLLDPDDPTGTCKMGRPVELTAARVDQVVLSLETMIDTADANYEVTLGMLMRRCRLKFSERTVADALHKRGYRFHTLRSKMILTPQDVQDRYRWAGKHRGKSRQWWISKICIHLDNHAFKVATTAKGRKLLAKRRVRGVYLLRWDIICAPTEQGILKIVQFADGHSVDTRWTLDGHSMDTRWTLVNTVISVHTIKESYMLSCLNRMCTETMVFTSVHRVSIECPSSVHQVSIVKLHNLAHIMLGPCLAPMLSPALAGVDGRK